MEEITDGYPLQWPAGWQRTQYAKTSRFGQYNSKPTIADGVYKTSSEIKLFGGTDLIISCNIKMKRDGLPYSNQRQPEDRGVAVYFTYEGQQRVIACDTFDKVGCNLWAISKSIESLRGIDRWGCSEILNKAFTGFTALPEARNIEWWEILMVDKNAGKATVKIAFHQLSKIYHPDVPGGNDIQFKEINAAYQKFLSL